MPTISILPRDGTSAVTSIRLGVSTPKLGGAVDISVFPGLTSFTGGDAINGGNDIASFTGFDSCPRLTFLSLDSNKIVGDFSTLFSTLSTRRDFTYFSIPSNRITGSLPSNLDALTAISQFRFQANQITGFFPTSFNNKSRLVVLDASANPNLSGNIPSPSACPNVGLYLFGACSFTGSIPPLTAATSTSFQFRCNTNKLTGSIPALPRNILEFTCFNNFLTGSIPSLDGLTNLQIFNCYGQLGTRRITGNVPSLSTNRSLRNFICYSNQLSGFTLAPVPSSIRSLSAQNNFFTLTAVRNCLSAFNTMVASYSGTSFFPLVTGGVINIGGSTMPRLSSAAAGPLNGQISSYVNYLSALPVPGWTITMGTSSIPG